jgi:hypothetical protein
VCPKVGQLTGSGAFYQRNIARNHKVLKELVSGKSFL